ncbi:hypothetical protein Pcinc_042876 [Petrolisthes cinctipes]|uniref:Uncharacterized protein n=1 Tax=Petrolisthes cinctipes TaxID=88211 RepID=A0AAE1EID5_PETCI|nr:hypothetical protein Pcinc_042876 [Petrolisthes cinctipes]
MPVSTNLQRLNYAKRFASRSNNNNNDDDDEEEAAMYVPQLKTLIPSQTRRTMNMSEGVVQGEELII